MKETTDDAHFPECPQTRTWRDPCTCPIPRRDIVDHLTECLADLSEGDWGFYECATAKDEIVRLRAAIIKGHWDAYPQPEEVRVPPYGEPDIECATCAGKWPCYAAEALGEQL